MIRFVAIVAMLGFVAFAGGCNTIEGMGKDVKAGGEAIEKGAAKAKPY